MKVSMYTINDNGQIELVDSESAGGIFELLNIGKNRGEKIAEGFDQHMKDFRKDLQWQALYECNCDGCKEEIARRIASNEAHTGSSVEEMIYGGKPVDPISVPDIMNAAADTYRERNALYGDSYKQFGGVMQALFPHGILIDTPDAWNRLGIINMMVSKLTRYTANFCDGGHTDSAHDLGVYSFMLEELTRLARGEH